MLDTVTDQLLREKTRTLTESALAMFVDQWMMVSVQMKGQAHLLM